MKHGSISVDVNTQNNKHWSENSSLIHEVLSYDVKVGVCCARSATKITEPFSFLTQLDANT